MAAANDEITITIIDLAYKDHEVSISQNATIESLQSKILELGIVDAPSRIHIRLWKPANNGITPIIFDKLDRTLANYQINNNDRIHVLMDPDQTYYNLNTPPVLTLRKTQRYNPGIGGKRSRRNKRTRRNKKSRRNRK